MAGWRGAEYGGGAEEEYSASTAFQDAFQIICGWGKILLLVFAIVAVVYLLFAGGVFSLGAKSCYICGQPVKIGYTMTVKRNFSIQETAKKVSASFKGDTQNTPEASRRYDLCDDCRNSVLSSLASARNGGSQ